MPSLCKSKAATVDDAVQRTNDSSIVSKESMENLGYTKSAHFLQEFVATRKRRAPLINRGYYVRTAALDYLIDQFCTHFGPDEPLQIVSLGCGFDPSAFRLASLYANHQIHYYDVDFGQVVPRKRALVSASDLLRPLANGSLCYTLLDVDLRNAQRLETSLQDAGFCSTVPTLVLVECVFTYIDSSYTVDIISKVSNLAPDCQMVLYEQVLPLGTETAFSMTMCRHFENISSRLYGLGVYPTKDHQRQRFTDAGFSDTQVLDLYEFWHNVLLQDERQRILGLEPFDEWEEWYMYCTHYMVANATKGRCAGLRYATVPNVTSPTLFKPQGIPLRSVAKLAVPVSVAGGSIALLDERKISLLGGFGTMAGGSGHSRLTTCSDLVLEEEFKSLRVSTANSLPAKMFAGAAVLQITPSLRLNVYFGGRLSPLRASNDLYYYDNFSLSWVPIKLACLNAPEARYRFGCCSNGVDTLYVYGGRNVAGITLDDLWRAHFTVSNDGAVGVCWTNLKVSGLPPLHSCTLEYISKEELWVLGGLGAKGRRNFQFTDENSAKHGVYALLSDTTALNFVATPLDLKNFEDGAIFCARFGHASLRLGDYIVVAGGCGYYHQAGSNQGGQVCVLSIEWKTWCCLTGPFSECDMLVNASLVDFGGGNRFAIAGGGATCFSMGSCYNQVLHILELPEPILRSRLKPPHTQVQTVSFCDHFQLHSVFRDVSEPLLLREVPIGKCLSSWRKKIAQVHPNPARITVHKSVTPFLDFTQKNFEYDTWSWRKLSRALSVADSRVYFYMRAVSVSNPKKKPSCIYTDFPYLASDFFLPTAFDALKPSGEAYFSSVLRMSSSSLRLWTHYDVMDNVLFNVIGRKKVILWSPNYVARLGVSTGSSSPITDLSQLDRDIWEARVEVILEPGDAIAIPSCWFHHVTSLEASVSVNVFYRGLPKEDYGVTRKDLYGNADVRNFEIAMRACNELLVEFKAGDLLPVALYLLKPFFPDLQAVRKFIPVTVGDINCVALPAKILLPKLKKMIKGLSTCTLNIHKQFYALKLVSILVETTKLAERT